MPSRQQKMMLMWGKEWGKERGKVWGKVKERVA